MAGHTVLIIGRSAHADIRLTDASVSRLHAELVLGGDGRLHVADRSSANGTWVEVDGTWAQVTQRRLAVHDRLRFGSHRIVASELMRRALGGEEFPGRARGKVAGVGRPTGDLARPLVRRDPLTGGVVED